MRRQIAYLLATVLLLGGCDSIFGPEDYLGPEDPGYWDLCVVYVHRADFERDPAAAVREAATREQLDRCEPLQVRVWVYGGAGSS